MGGTTYQCCTQLTRRSCDTCKTTKPLLRPSAASTMSKLNGKVVCFTGTLTVKRADAEKTAAAAGATISKSVTAKTDILVAGADAGKKKAKAAPAAAAKPAAKKTTAVKKPAAKKTTAVKKVITKPAPPPTPPAKKSAPISAAAATTVAAAAQQMGGDVDSACPISGTVFKDYDCMLNQTDIKNNANKFIKSQLVQSVGGIHHFKRWGRVGEPGATQMKGPFSSEE